MKQISLLCLCALLLVGVGCSQSSQVNNDPTPSSVVAEGMESIPPRSNTTVTIPATTKPGNLTATLMWPGTETRVVASFQKGTPDNRGWMRARSPLISKVNVTERDVADGGGWTLTIANTSCCSVLTVRYAVRFTPEPPPDSTE